MDQRAEELIERILDFSAETIAFTKSFPNDPGGWTIARQIIRSSTSIGANYQEAQYSRSRAEFVSKTHIALQEASETLYWFRTIEKCGMGDIDQLPRLRNEANQLVRILVAVTGTAKRRQ